MNELHSVETIPPTPPEVEIEFSQPHGEPVFLGAIVGITALFAALMVLGAFFEIARGFFQ